MKLLEMSDLTVTHHEASNRPETVQTKHKRRERPLSALPEQPVSERLEEIREGIKRVILAIWTAKA